MAHFTIDLFSSFCLRIRLFGSSFSQIFAMFLCDLSVLFFFIMLSRWVSDFITTRIGLTFVPGLNTLCVCSMLMAFMSGSRFDSMSMAMSVVFSFSDSGTPSINIFRLLLPWSSSASCCSMLPILLFISLFWLSRVSFFLCRLWLSCSNRTTLSFRSEVLAWA